MNKYEIESLLLSNTPQIRRTIAARAKRGAAVELLSSRYYIVPMDGSEISARTISSILSTWYYAEIRAITESIIRDVRVGRGIDAPKPREYVHDELHDAADNAVREWVMECVDARTDDHEYVIYTYKAKLVLVASEHADAYEEEIGGKATVEARACMAMRADVWEHLNAREDEWLHVEGPESDVSDDEIDLANGERLDVNEPTPTTAQIEALRGEARLSGDDTLVNTCNRALGLTDDPCDEDDRANALRTCADVIASSRVVA